MPIFGQAGELIDNDQTYDENVILAAAGIVFTNTSSGRVHGEFIFSEAGSQLINESGGYIGAPDNVDPYTFQAITGSSGADTIWDSGNIQGLVSLGDGNDVLISNSATSTYASTQYGADLGSGDDVLRFEGTSAPLYPYGDGGDGTDTFEFAATTNQVFGTNLTNFEILSIQASGTYNEFSGYTQIVGTPGSLDDYINGDFSVGFYTLVDCINPLVDLALGGAGFWNLIDSVVASVTGSDGNDQFIVGGSTQILNGVSLGSGDDYIGFGPTATAVSLGAPIDGGEGYDGLAYSLQTVNSADSLANVTGFEYLTVSNGGEVAGESIQLSDVSGIEDIYLTPGLGLILSSGDLATTYVGGAVGGFVEIAASVTIADYAYGHWAEYIDTGLTEADNLNSTVFTNQGTVLGSVIFKDGDDHYDGTLGSVGAVHGNAGDDLIEGGVNVEVLYGDAGSDTIYGNGGNDELYGGSEDDILDGGEGIDTLSGGTGADYFVYTSFNHAPTGGQLDRIADFEVGIDKIDLSALTVSSYTIETSGAGYILTAFGPEGAMAIQVDSAGPFSEADVIFGNHAPVANDDTVSVDEDAVVTGNILANDSDVDGDSLMLVSIEGNTSLPTIIAGSFGTLAISVDGEYSYEANADIVDTLAPGTIVTDTFAYTISDGSLSDSATLTVNVTAIADGVTVDATKGSTDITGTAGDDILVGGGGGESIWGGEGFDQLSGDNGNDTLDGGAGIDLLDGGKGNDDLIGGNGDDLLIGGRGHDYFEGGPGADIFMFEEATRSTGSDVIADFSVGEDAIYLIDGLEIVSIVEASGDTTLSLSNGGEIVLSGVAGIPDAGTVLTDTLPSWFSDADAGPISLLTAQNSQDLDTSGKVSEPSLVQEILGELAASTEVDALIDSVAGNEPEILNTSDGNTDSSALLDVVFEGQNDGTSFSFDLPADLTVAESLHSASA